jgi:hypothetical protein
MSQLVIREYNNKIVEGLCNKFVIVNYFIVVLNFINFTLKIKTVLERICMNIFSEFIVCMSCFKLCFPVFLLFI